MRRDKGLAATDRILFAGTTIGALGVILLWRKIGAFWLGGTITAAACVLFALHYGLQGRSASPTARFTRRGTVSLAAAASIALLGLGLLYLSVLSLSSQPAGTAGKAVGNALPIVGVLFGVFVVLDMVNDQADS